MAQVRLSIGGRSYELVCREGEEGHYEALAQRIDAKAEEVLRAVGGVSEARLLMLTSLLLADELDGRAPPSPAATAAVQPAVPPGLVDLLDGIADRLETLCRKLEKPGPSA